MVSQLRRRRYRILEQNRYLVPFRDIIRYRSAIRAKHVTQRRILALRWCSYSGLCATVNDSQRVRRPGGEGDGRKARPKPRFSGLNTTAPIAMRFLTTPDRPIASSGDELAVAAHPRLAFESATACHTNSSASPTTSQALAPARQR
jgi:hypothetical protein